MNRKHSVGGSQTYSALNSKRQVMLLSILVICFRTNQFKPFLLGKFIF